MTPVAQKPEKYTLAENPSRSSHTGHWRTFTPVREPKLAPCERACPCGSPIPDWLSAVKRENWEKAWQIMRLTNPFPAITGRVCYRYCQDNCYRQQLDEGVAISQIEQEIGDRRHNLNLPPLRRRVSGKVAIVGSGPAGLSCAYYLRQQGVQVTIYERAAVPGGMLALAIPEYRLPRRILDRELELLAAGGLRFRLNCRLDRQEITGLLSTGYQAVFLAAGAPQSLLPDISGLDLGGVWTALDFLEEANLGRKPELQDPVIVIGGGNTALDVARMALRQEGISEVTVIYRGKRGKMKAQPSAVAAAEQEGIKFIFDTCPETAWGNKRVESIVCVSTGRGPAEASVRYRCRTLILATGQQRDNNLHGLWEQDRPMFVGGDQLTGPSSVPAAIAGGRKGAQEIFDFLQGDSPRQSPPGKKEIAFSDLHLKTWPGYFTHDKYDNPVQEAGRCIGCGNCNGCGICSLFCPDVAVFWDGEKYSVDLDYCKGCGICAQECPSGVLEMEGVQGAC